ncbi:MAG: UDP-N-acetylglucosamine 2-epimerase (non-hydrolyzing) [Pseudomonadota bacterium]
MNKRLLFIFGTRPEAIKMAPLIKLAKESEAEENKNFDVTVCVTGQHRQMLDQVLEFFGITPDFDLDIMTPGQNLFDVTSIGISRLKDVISRAKPDVIFVQGDTTTAFMGALAGYYTKTKVAHIEAGLRSGDKFSPWPEEGFREMVSHIADYHFVPTKLAAENLAKENVTKNVHITGNTVIDALFMGLDIIKGSEEEEYIAFFEYLDLSKKTILITGHRRESFGSPLENICIAIKRLALEHPDMQFIYPVHKNPNVKSVVENMLSDLPNVFLIEPLDYQHIIYLMNKSYIIITDSGGIQEEAPSLGKPVLVTRDVTERTEGIEAGGARLVGTNTEAIYLEAKRLFIDEDHYKSMSIAANPYGEGKASEKILGVITNEI